MEKKSKAEIKKAMHICANSSNCSICPYWAKLEENEYCNDECITALIKDALKEISSLEDTIDNLTEANNILSGELDKSRRESKGFVIRAEKHFIKARVQELVSLRATLLGKGLQQGQLTAVDFNDEITRRISEYKTEVAKRKDKE